MDIVMRYSPLMRRVALGYVRSPAVADEVVQEAWLGVLTGLSRFERRSSLKTWILRIVVNTAKSRGVREARSLPFASLGPDAGSSEATTAPELSNRSNLMSRLPPLGAALAVAV